MNKIEGFVRPSRVKSSFNPLFYWITLAWCASKVLLWTTRSTTTVWETGWNWFLDIFGEDEYKIIVYGTGGLGASIVIGVSAFFLFMDLFLRPASLRKYKVQLHTNEPVDKMKVFKAVLLIVFNQIFVNTPFVVLFFYAYKWRGIPDMRLIEDFPTVIINVFLNYVIYDVCFYFSHRLLHYKFFYKYVHKVHHEWTASIAIIALYAHPVEHLIVNLGSVFTGSLVTGCHVATFWLYFAFQLISTLGDHSGYHLPFLHSSEYHDYHHLKFTTNYGATGWLDYLFGTDTAYHKTINSTRHRTLFTTKSAREMFPDPPTLKED